MQKSLQQYRNDVKKAKRIERQTAFHVASTNDVDNPHRDDTGKFPPVVLRFSLDREK